MPRPSYKQLYVEEQKKREKVAQQTKKEMKALMKQVEDVQAVAQPLIEGHEYSAREAMYIQQIAELQQERFRLLNKIEDLEVDIAAANAILNKK